MKHKKVTEHKGRIKRIKISKVKANIRNEIEDKNDIYDLLADTSNALNDVLIHLSTLSTPAIEKYKLRQNEIINILNENDQ